MPNTLLHKRGTSKPSPSDLLVGEIAINTLEGKLFTENDSGYIWEAGELLGTFSGTTITYTVTVASKTSSHRYNGQGSSLGYKINGVFSPFLTLTPGNTYRFDQSDSSNSNHPLKFYLEADKSTLYSTDVSINGTAGQSGAYTEIIISDTTPLVLHYQCGFHGYMGNAVFCNSKTVNYNDLQNKPSLFSGNYNDLSNKPSLFSGDYDDLSNKPSLFSGSYNDLSNKPTIPTLTSQLTNDAGFITSGGGGLTDGDKGDIVVSNGGDTLTVDSGVIDNANIASNAAIAGSKISPDFGSQDIKTTGNIKAQGASSVLQVGDIGNDNFVQLTQVTNSSSVRGFTNQHQNASVLENLQGTTNQHIVLGDVNIDSTGVLLGVSLTQSGTTYTRLSLSGVGDLSIARNIIVGGTIEGVLKNGVTATTQSAGDNSTKVATTAYTDTAIANLADSAPSTLNTLNELAAALGDDANFSTTVTNSIATKLPLAGGTLTGTLTISNAAPNLLFTDSDHNPDFGILASSGQFRIQDHTNSNNLMTLDSSKIQAVVNLDALAGLDVTGGKLTITSSDAFALTFNNSQSAKIDLRGSDDPYIQFTEGSTSKAYIQWNSAGYLDIKNKEDSARLLIRDNLSFSQDGSNFGKVWNQYNDGSGSGLDADTLDGLEAGAFLRNDQDNNVSNHDNQVRFYSDTSIHTTSSYQASLEVFQPTAQADAFMAFHISGDYGGYFGLDGGINDFACGGWSFGNNRYRFWHQGNDGSGSGLDADTLDGVQGSSFLRSDASDSFAHTLTWSGSAGGVPIDLASNDGYASFRVIRNNNSSGGHADGMYIGYSNQNNGATRIYGGGSTTGALVVGGPSDVKINGNTVFHAGNDGAGSGLDADKLDGQQGSHYLDYDNFTNKPTIPTDNNQLTNGAGYITSAALAGASDGGNAALLDGIDSTQFLRSDQDDSFTGTITANSDATNPVIKIQGAGPNFIQFATDSSGTVNNNSINLVYRTSPNTLAFERASDAYIMFSVDSDDSAATFGGAVTILGNTVWHAGNDGSGSGLDADKLDGLQASVLVKGNGTNNGVTEINVSGADFIVEDTTDGTTNFIWRDHSASKLYLGTPTAIVTARSHVNPNADSTFNLGANGTRWANIYADTLYGNGSNVTNVNADTLDGVQGSSFVRNDNGAQTIAGNLTVGTGTASYIYMVDSDNGTRAIHNNSNFIGFLKADGNWGSRCLDDGSWQILGNTAWHAGNDGSGSGLDADKLDGQQGSYYRNASNLNAGTFPDLFGSSVRYNIGLIDGHNGSSYDKLRVWNSSSYTIGMNDSMTYGWLNDYAMTFTMNNESDRGFVWRDTDDAKSDAAMTLTTSGNLMVKNAIGIAGKTGNYWKDGSWGFRHQTPHGYIEFGPANSSHAHIYTDRSNFYFNKTDIRANGNTMWHAGNDGSGSGLDADTLDGVQGSSYLRSDAADTGTTLTLTDALRADRFEDQGGGFFFREGLTSGRHRHLNLADTNSDPASVSDSHNPTGISWGKRTDNNAYYMLGLKGSYNNGYSTHSRLTLAWHTGIEIGASSSYGGVRFMADSPFLNTTEIMHVNSSGGHVKVTNNLYANNGGLVWNANNDGSGSGLDADTVDGIQGSSIITDSSSQSKNIYIRNGAPTMYFRDTNNNSAMLHTNSSIFYILRGGNDATSWTQVNSHWPLEINLTNNDATFGRNLSARGNVTAYSSDKRLKENLKHIESPLDKVQKLNGYTFDWISKIEEVGFVPDHKKNDIGLLAQEVNDVLPQAVAPAPFDIKWDKDKMKNISKSGQDYLTVQYERLVPLLIESIKELTNKVKVLENKLNVE